MALEKEFWHVRKSHDSLVFRRLDKRLRGTKWRHYKGNYYTVVEVLWDATQDEWAVKYMPDAAVMTTITYTRTLSDWCGRPFVDAPEVFRFTELG